MVVLVKSWVEKCQQLKRRVAYVCRPPCFPHNLPVTVCGQTKNSAVIHVVRQADQSNQLLVCPLSSWSAQSQVSLLLTAVDSYFHPGRTGHGGRDWCEPFVLVLCHLCVYLYYVLLLYLVIYIKNYINPIRTFNKFCVKIKVLMM